MAHRLSPSEHDRKVCKRAWLMQALFLVVFALLLVAPPALAQECLKVTVVDPSGAAVADATVSIGVTELPTDDFGVVMFRGLRPGPHSVVATAPGLTALEQTVTQPLGEARIALALATVSEQIVVESAVPVAIVDAPDITE